MALFYPFTFLFILFFLLLVRVPPSTSFTDANNYALNSTHNNDSTVVGNIAASNPSPSLEETRPNASFKPSIAVIVGVLTTLFSITFLLLLYARHCKSNNGNRFSYTYTNGSSLGTVSARKNSGINRAVVESLPLFRFSSLTGKKDWLECAVCLTRFDPSELLRLLPKCKHAFHVECVDTWLDAHSTCPLCRYRVDPEDILLIEDEAEAEAEEEEEDSRQNQDLPASCVSSCCLDFEGSTSEAECSRTRRVSGRHSYAGERATSSGKATSSFRRSLDSSRGGGVAGCRKDGLLLSREEEEKIKRLEHRIIVSVGVGGSVGRSGSRGGFYRRWSDVQPSDLFYLRSEMIISQSRRLGIGSSISLVEAEDNNNNSTTTTCIANGNGNKEEKNGSESERARIGGSVIDSRSVSEITGLSRFSSKVMKNNNITFSNAHHRGRQRQGQAAATAAGLVSRWLAWISSASHSDVRSQPMATVADFS